MTQGDAFQLLNDDACHYYVLQPETMKRETMNAHMQWS